MSEPRIDHKKYFFFAGCMCFLFAAAGIYTYFSENTIEFASKNKGRNLELGTAESTNKPTKDESVVFNDPAMSQKWDLGKTDAQRAWKVSKGSRQILVAVIDTGADIKHEDLVANLWLNPGESGVVDSDKCKKEKEPLKVKNCNKATNNFDDDKNGFKDDIHGWNFVSNNSDLSDNHGHGTHIAGIIGAEAGNGKGVTGIAPEVSMMILKYYDPKVPHTDNLKNTIAAIEYAIKMKAHIINYSGGGLEFSPQEKDAVDEARRKGILFVAAAGNERSNSDIAPYFPADYKLSNIISVTAIDPATQVLSSSNYGIESVHIAAPGQNILSTLPGNAYGFMTGTSQATAFVTGAAAVVMAHKENYVAEDVKKYIVATGDQLTTLQNKTLNARKLNLYKALTVFDTGTSASGIVSENTASTKPFTIDSKIEVNGLESTSNVSRFGKSLVQALGQVEKKNTKSLPRQAVESVPEIK
ncbi:MAG: S8 family peptidase [Pseudobdellovibrionaceae bacterium]